MRIDDSTRTDQGKIPRILYVESVGRSPSVKSRRHPASLSASPLSQQPLNGLQDFGAFGVQGGDFVDDSLRRAVGYWFGTVGILH